MPVKDEVFGMEPQTGTVLETVSVDALARSLLRATYPVEFIVGRVRLNCKEPAVIRTPLGIMNLEAGTECVATVTNEETTVMSSFDTLKRVAPSALLVTVLSGGVQTIYAQEAPAPVQPRKPVAAKPVEEPRVTVRFENMKIQVAIRLIASKAKRRVVIDHALEGSLTTNLKSIPWRQALTLMGETCNFVWHEDGQGVLYVMRKAKQQNQETLPWHLDRALTQHDAQSIKRLKEWAAEIDRVLRRVDPNARQGVLGQLIPQPRVVDIRVGAVDAVVVRPANGAGGRAGNGVVGRPATGAAAAAALVRLQADAEVKDLQKRFAALETRLAAAKALLATASRQHLPNAYLSRLQEAEEIKLRIARCQAAVDQAAKAGDNAAAEEALRKYSLARQAWVAHSRLKKTEATIARFVAQGEYEAARAAADECARKKRDLDKILRTLRPQPDVK
jgi:hypothetical protein